MRKSILTVSTVLFLAVPAVVSAQGLGIAARAGTLGVGAEIALGLTDAFVIRGGLGLTPLEPSLTIDDIDFTLTLPETWFNVGADLYLGGSFRIGGGMLFKPDDFSIVGEITGSTTIEIGDEMYDATQVSQLRGTLDSEKQAPYVLIGFGKHTSSGIGLFLDLGAAFLGDSNVILTATGDPAVVNSPEFQAELRKQETNIEDDFASYIKIWPIVNIGLRIGVGG